MKKVLIFGLTCLSLALLFTNCEQEGNASTTPGMEGDELQAAKDNGVSVARGEHLVTIMDCNICHTRKKMTDRGPVPDMAYMLSGHPAESKLPEIDKAQIAPGKWVLFNQDFTAAVGPWGVSFSANLTPHETGLGNWTLDQFKKALREGKHKGLDNGRMILPPMPWEAFASLDDKDIESIYEYLKTIPPIDNLVPEPIPPTEL